MRACDDVGLCRLSGVDAFTIDYTVKWPVSLVLSRAALTKYQPARRARVVWRLSILE